MIDKSLEFKAILKVLSRFLISVANPTAGKLPPPDDVKMAEVLSVQKLGVTRQAGMVKLVAFVIKKSALL